METKTIYFYKSAIILPFAIMLLLCGCVENKLKTAIEKANVNLPVSIGAAGELTSISYEDNAVVFLYTLDEQFTNIDILSSNTELMKSSISTFLRNEKMKTFFALLVEENTDLCMIFKGKATGKEASMKLTSIELKQELDKPASTNEDKLKASIATANQQMPLDTGTGIIVTEVVEKDNQVLYLSKVSDKNQFEMIANNTEGVKNSMKLMIKMMGPAEKQIFQLIVESGKYLGYSYYMDNGDETINIVLTNSELSQLLE